MIKLSNGSFIIGFDDGYQLGKTANFVFDNGVHMIGNTPPTLKENSLLYDGGYYKVGEGRAAITEDKVSDENGRVLTMAAIAKELKRADRKRASVILAVGLPFSNFGRDRQKLVDYYGKKPKLKFVFEEIKYDIDIERVIVCPQCYSAIASRLGNMKDDYLIVDIGSKTTDIVYVQNGLPIESRSITIEKAMVKWMKEIQRDLKVQTGKDIPEHEVMKIVLKQGSNLPAAYTELIRGMLREKVHFLELELAERGYNLDYTNIIYVGGGALVARDYAGKNRSHVAYDCDLCANAKGYEFLANQMIRKQVA